MKDGRDKEIVIFNQEIARSLMKKGFKLVSIDKNRDQPVRTVFFFENTEVLREHLSRWYDIHL